MQRIQLSTTQKALAAAALAAVLPGVASATSYQWTPTGSGSYSWNSSGNWTSTPSGGTFPGVAGDVANLNSNITSDESVALGQSLAIGVLNIGDSGATYRNFGLSGAGLTLTFDNGASNAQVNKSGDGNDSIAVANTALNSALDVTNSSSTGLLTFSRVVNGTNGAKAINLNGGTVKFGSSVSTFSGGVNLTAGTLALGADSAGNAGSVTQGVIGTGTLSLGTATVASADATAHTVNNPLTLAGDTTFGQMAGGTGALTFGGAASLTAARQLTVNTATTFGGAVTGTFALTKNGASTLTFSATTAGNTFNSLTISDGEVDVAAANNLGTGTITLAAGTTIAGSGTAILSLNNNITLAGNATASSSYASGGSQLTGVISESTAGSKLTINHAPGGATVRNFILNKTNTFTGGIDYNGNALSMLSLQNTNALGGGAGGTGGRLAFTGTGGVVALGTNSNARSQTIAGVSGSVGAVVGGASAASTLALNVPESTSYTYTGSVGGSLTNQNNLALVKDGAGTQILGGTLTYTGGTVVSNGLLLIDGTSSGGATVNGGTLGGSGSFGGAIVINSAGSIAPGSNGIGALIDNSTLTLAGTGVFELSKSGATLTNDKITDIAAAPTFTDGSLNLLLSGSGFAAGDAWDLFDWTGGTAIGTLTINTVAPSGLAWDTTQLSSAGVVSLVAAPEPTAAALGTVLLGATLLRRRRQEKA